MKRYKFFVLPLMLVVAVTSCKKSAFVKDNINPGTLQTVDPGAQFMYACAHTPNDNEAYYDFYRDIMPWLQYTTAGGGNVSGFESPASSHFNNRYNNFYTNVGLALSDVPYLVEALDSSERPGRVYELAINSIFKAYYGWYVSDISGDIPYSQAFEARYGGTLTPVYDVQQNLFDSLDLQVKAAVATLESSPSASQVLYGADDLFYGGSGNEVMAWIKAGNALRLKMATRLMKANPSGMTAIVQEVLADPNQMSSNTDSWVLEVGPNYADWQGNYNPSGFLASKAMVNFMNQYSDPREPVFYRLNSNGAYVGSVASPDSARTPYWQAIYTASDTPVSLLQHRLWTPNYNEADGYGLGTGNGYFPILTYPEYCFIRADLGARGYTTDNAGNWYTAGVTASIQEYDAWASAAGVTHYVPVTTGQISNYLGLPGITFNAARATEQIACQAYIEFFKQPAEGWAWWKRTGYPSTTSVLAWEPLIDNGSTATIARRAPLVPLPSSDANYANQQAAFKDMSGSPNWGATPDNSFGRVWWDMP
jgi:hypothetical protein